MPEYKFKHVTPPQEPEKSKKKPAPYIPHPENIPPLKDEERVPQRPVEKKIDLNVMTPTFMMERIEQKLGKLGKDVDQMIHIPAYKSKQFPDVEYYDTEPYMIIHNKKTDKYLYGGEWHAGTFPEIVADIRANYERLWMAGKLKADSPYIEEFCDLYAEQIINMLKHLDAADTAGNGDGHQFLTIHAAFVPYLEKYGLVEEDLEDVEEEEESADVVEEEEFITDEDVEDVYSTSDEDASQYNVVPPIEKIVVPHSVQEEVEAEDAAMTLPEMDSLESDSEDTSTSNLRRYAEQIDAKVPDEDAMDIIRQAREARHNRVYQQDWSSQ